MKQFSKFILVGLANTILGYSVIFSCMYLAGLTAISSNAIGYIVGLVASYLMNRHFTFKSAQQCSTEFARFMLVFLTAYTVNLVALIFLIRVIGVHAVLGQVVAGCAYIGTTYLLNKRYVFQITKAN